MRRGEVENGGDIDGQFVFMFRQTKQAETFAKFVLTQHPKP
ncbi:hypothetical protein HMPREF9371_0749 [Neisseria shayeganii 871]|uniref:Uncharacterized protein n=1 Tax=Neisseria shayeganii 871 TaxID=1032488 RepID=G4CGL0_9NEIS|nr:hypothetical protein HMPREF9371_0749 [Neisseria shayeganii 871]